MAMKPVVSTGKCSFDLDSSDDEQPSIEVTTGKRTRNSRFDLSDSDDDDGGVQETAASAKVASVVAEIVESTRVSAEPFAAVTVEENIDTVDSASGVSDTHEEEDISEEEFVPLRAPSSKAKRVRPKKKVDDHPRLDPFDYVTALKKDATTEKKKKPQKRFDVFGSFEQDTGPVKRRRVRKPNKNPSSGSKTLSYKAPK